jgi:hypothetical protein
MACAVCNDKGLVRVRYKSREPDAYGLCLCPTGRGLYDTTNARHVTNPLWHAVAAQRGIPIDAVVPIETLYDDAELAAMFPTRAPEAHQPALEDALIAVGKTKRRGHL